jgi:hypothetical protein
VSREGVRAPSPSLSLLMELGFLSWSERHVPTWRKLGYDETWIRQRIETAQITRGLHRKLKQKGLTILEIREELRKAYADHPEQPDSVRVVRDLSTVEELELALALSRYALHLLDAPESLTKDQLASLMEAHGKQLRATFIARYGYPPKDSTTPYVPVTIEGPQDHDVYML